MINADTSIIISNLATSKAYTFGNNCFNSQWLIVLITNILVQVFTATLLGQDALSTFTALVNEYKYIGVVHKVLVTLDLPRMAYKHFVMSTLNGITLDTWTGETTYFGEFDKYFISATYFFESRSLRCWIRLNIY